MKEKVSLDELKQLDLDDLYMQSVVSFVAAQNEIVGINQMKTRAKQ